MNAVLRNNRVISLKNSRPSIRILAELNELHAQLRDFQEGTVASYIPELAHVDPNLLGICVVTCQGEIFSVGDTECEFTLQSIANPFMYGIALDHLGRGRVEQAVGGRLAEVRPPYKRRRRRK